MANAVEAVAVFGVPPRRSSLARLPVALLLMQEPHRIARSGALLLQNPARARCRQYVTLTPGQRCCRIKAAHAFGTRDARRSLADFGWRLMQRRACTGVRQRRGGLRHRAHLRLPDRHRCRQSRRARIPEPDDGAVRQGRRNLSRAGAGGRDRGRAAAELPIEVGGTATLHDITGVPDIGNRAPAPLPRAPRSTCAIARSIASAHRSGCTVAADALVAYRIDETSGAKAGCMVLTSRSCSTAS